MNHPFQEVAKEDINETPTDFSEFLAFTTRSNIPLSEEQLLLLKTGVLNSKGSLNKTVIEHGVTRSKYWSSNINHEKRCQDTLWRAWWQLTRAGRFNEIQEGGDVLEEATGEAIPEVRTLRVCGTEIGDFPTVYTIPALKPHEFPVVGTFVDRHIIPGFAYCVRRNGTDDYLFDGVALLLKSIGRGYGKRLTFESEDIENDNFFWSDSNPEEGFVFSIQVVFVGDHFNVVDRKGRVVGETHVKSVGLEQEIKKVSTHKSVINVEVSVKMDCTLKFSSQDHIPEKLRDQSVDICTGGLSLAIKEEKSLKWKTTDVRNLDILDLGKCSFQCFS
ncbi:uncharacterized protein LOC141880962 [Acropora palmata]|uniref:uncharacterized protein LOC141880962 n=1 Tax=Acropora palmata TaxID=6131 RepID=UPI003DA0FB26